MAILLEETIRWIGQVFEEELARAEEPEYFGERRWRPSRSIHPQWNR